MRYVIIVVSLFLLFPAIVLSQGMDIVEIDIDDNILYWLYHYEPKYIMGQIFGSPDFDELGYTIGPYWSNQFIKVELPVGAQYKANTPSQQSHWKAKLNCFASFPSWANPEFEITFVNDFGWGRNNNPDTRFSKLQFIYTPIEAGIHFRTFKMEGKKSSTCLGLVKRVKFGPASFVLFQGKDLKKDDWSIRLDVFLTYFHK